MSYPHYVKCYTHSNLVSNLHRFATHKIKQPTKANSTKFTSNYLYLYLLQFTCKNHGLELLYYRTDTGKKEMNDRTTQ